MKQFAIVTMPRCGSTWLCSALDQHPLIVCDGELFHGHRIERHSWGRGEQESSQIYDPAQIAQRDADAGSFMDAVQVEAKQAEANFYGFKHILVHSKAGKQFILDRPDIDVIVLYRRDLLAQYASRLRAEMSGAWTSLHKPENSDLAKPSFRPIAFLEFCYAMDSPLDIFCNALGANRRVLTVAYEDVVLEKNAGVILEFLGLESRQIEGAFRKQSAESGHAAFSNPLMAYVVYWLWKRVMPDDFSGRAGFYRVLKPLKRAVFGKKPALK